MGASIDQLQIDINASATKANTAIDKLVVKLDKVQTSLAGLNGNSLTSFANGVQQLGTAMQTMNGVKTSDFTRLSKNLQKLSKIDTGSINKASNAIANMSKSFSGLSGVSQSAEQIKDVAKGISQLGYKSSTQAIENIPKLAKAMNELMTSLSKAPKVSQNLINMTNALAKLARTGSSGGKAANSLAKNLNTYTSATGKATKGTFNLASALGKMYATYWMLFRAFGKLGEAINISSDLTEVQNVVDVTFGKYKTLVEEMSNTSITNFGMSELTVKQISSRFQAMGVAMGFTQGKMADMSVELTKLAADMASFYNVEQADVAEDLSAIFTGMTRPLRAYGLDLTQATLQEWAHRNGMSANIKTMSQAEKTMLRYQYVLANTGAAQGDFARTSNTWANQVRILKQNFEQLAIIIGGTMINALKPLVSAMNKAMSTIISFAQTVANALGQIFGWKYEINSGGVANDFEDAAGASDDIASGLGDAEKAAKKLRSYVLGIDELNIIEPDQGSSSGSSGGSGGGGGVAGGEGMDLGKLVRTESVFEKFKSDIDSLYKLGDYIGKTLTSTLEGIDWENVYKGAKNFGKGLASFLNGLISPELFGAVGKTIAGSLNTAIYAALSFGQTFDFKNFGKSIAEGINKFFQTFDFKSLAKTIKVWAKGIKDTIVEVLKNIKWKDVFKGIKDFLKEIDLETVGIIIGLVTLNEIKKIVLGFSLLTAVKTALTKAIAGVPIALSGLKILLTGGLIADGGLIANIGNAIALAVGGAGTLHEALVATFGGVTTAVAGILGVVSGAVLSITNFLSMLTNGFSTTKELLMGLGIAITAIGAIILGAPAIVTGVIAAITLAISTLVILIKDNWTAIKQWFIGIPTWFATNVIEPLKTKFKNGCSLIAEFFSYLWKDIKDVWKDVCTWFVTTVVTPLGEKFKTFKTNVVDLFTYLWSDIKKVWKDVCTWFDTTVTKPIGTLFSTLKTNVAQYFTDLWSGIKTTWSLVKQWFTDNVITPVTTLFSTFTSDISSAFDSAWSDIKTTWLKASTWFDEKVLTPVKTAFSAACTAIGGYFDAIWSSIKKGIVNTMNGVITAIESGINSMVKGINSVVSGFNKVANWVGDKVGQNWGGVTLVSEVALGRIKAFENGGFPNAADLFFANENGVPELVGTVGGKTAVASGTEITGISNAVYDTGNNQAMLLRQAIGLLQEIADKDMSVKIGDRDIARANQRGQRSMGARLRTT